MIRRVHHPQERLPEEACEKEPEHEDVDRRRNHVMLEDPVMSHHKNVRQDWKCDQADASDGNVAPGEDQCAPSKLLGSLGFNRVLGRAAHHAITLHPPGRFPSSWDY
jgi:hypothetical protein